MTEFVSSKTRTTIARALFGDRANRCKSLVIILTPDDCPTVMAEFYISEEEGQSLAIALETESWQLVDAEPSAD